MKRTPEFATEAEMCAAFIEACREHAPEWTAYAETAGFDILLAHRDGVQVGIQAKLRLNEKVADQIVPDDWAMSGRFDGPDFRVVLVPTYQHGGLAKLLGIVGIGIVDPVMWRSGVLWTQLDQCSGAAMAAYCPAWLDWNPEKRCPLPEFVPDVQAGVPSPIVLSAWKIGALRVLADLEVNGSITRQRIRMWGVDPRRFCDGNWLKQAAHGSWKLGDLPRFDLQHPVIYADVLSKARESAARLGTTVATAESA